MAINPFEIAIELERTNLCSERLCSEDFRWRRGVGREEEDITGRPCLRLGQRERVETESEELVVILSKAKDLQNAENPGARCLLLLERLCRVHR